MFASHVTQYKGGPFAPPGPGRGEEGGNGANVLYRVELTQGGTVLADETPRQVADCQSWKQRTSLQFVMSKTSLGAHARLFGVDSYINQKGGDVFLLQSFTCRAKRVECVTFFYICI